MAMDMFLELTNIKGETKDQAFNPKGGIDVLAWSWGASNSGNAQMGGGAGAGKVNVQDISVTKYIDKSTPVLLQHCSTGKHITEAKLTVRKAGGKPLEYLVITMNEVLVSALSTGGSGGEDRLTENLSLNFAKVKVEYTIQKDDGGKGETIPFAYDIAANVESG